MQLHTHCHQCSFFDALSFSKHCFLLIHFTITITIDILQFIQLTLSTIDAKVHHSKSKLLHDAAQKMWKDSDDDFMSIRVCPIQTIQFPYCIRHFSVHKDIDNEQWIYSKEFSIIKLIRFNSIQSVRNYFTMRNYWF